MVALSKLWMSDAAIRLDDFRVPRRTGEEKLHGDPQSHHGIRVSDPWRICFAWRDEGAWDVEIVDYH